MLLSSRFAGLAGISEKRRDRGSPLLKYRRDGLTGPLARSEASVVSKTVLQQCCCGDKIRKSSDRKVCRNETELRSDDFRASNQS